MISIVGFMSSIIWKKDKGQNKGSSSSPKSDIIISSGFQNDLAAAIFVGTMVFSVLNGIGYLASDTHWGQSLDSTLTPNPDTDESTNLVRHTKSDTSESISIAETTGSKVVTDGQRLDDLVDIGTQTVVGADDIILDADENLFDLIKQLQSAIEEVEELEVTNELYLTLRKDAQGSRQTLEKTIPTPQPQHVRQIGTQTLPTPQPQHVRQTGTQTLQEEHVRQTGTQTLQEEQIEVGTQTNSVLVV